MTNGTSARCDLASIDEAIDRWADTVWRLTCARMRNDHDAADAFQNTFLALCKARPTFNSLEHQKAWLLRCACNCCAQIARRRRAHPTCTLDDIEVADDRPGPEHDLELDQMLATLSEAQRTAVHLFYFEGYSTDEIARITGERPATVRSHLHRARQALRLELERQNGDAPCPC